MTLLLLILPACTAASASSASHGRLVLHYLAYPPRFLLLSHYLALRPVTTYDSPGLLRIYVGDR